MKLRSFFGVISPDAVAPARERGLKSSDVLISRPASLGRSRKGAWIEIHLCAGVPDAPSGRSRKGAWIEMLLLRQGFGGSTVAPARERGLK